MPQSLRLMVNSAFAVTAFPSILMVAGKVTARVVTAQIQVAGHGVVPFPSADALMAVLLKVAVGCFSAKKKSSLFRCVSSFLTRAYDSLGR